MRAPTVIKDANGTDRFIYLADGSECWLSGAPPAPSGLIYPQPTAATPVVAYAGKTRFPAWAIVIALAAGAFIGAALAIWVFGGSPRAVAGGPASRPTTLELFDDAGQLRFKVGPREKGNHAFAMEMYYADGSRAAEIATFGASKAAGTTSICLYRTAESPVIEMTASRTSSWIDVGADNQIDKWPAIHIGSGKDGVPMIQMKPLRNKKSLILWVPEYGAEINILDGEEHRIWHAP